METATFAKLLSALAFLGNSVTTSVAPFCAPADVSAISALQGTYEPMRAAGDSGAAPEVFEFTTYEPGGANGKLQISVEGRVERFYVLPFRLAAGGRELRLVDLQPVDESSGSAFYRRHLVYAHSVLRVETRKDSLALSALDAKALAPELAKLASADGLLTAPTPRLTELLLAAARKNAFTPPVELFRVRRRAR